MNNPDPQGLSRARFLKLCTKIALSLAGLLGLGGLIRYFSHKPASGPPSSYLLGLADDFPASGKLVRPDIPAIIYQNEDGFKAFSLICTHLGCTLEVSGDGFACPCHGSEFEADGTVSKGPAVEDLHILDVEITERGELVVHREGGSK